MLTTTTLYETSHGGKYLAQLCKHFAHKIPVEWSDAEGRIEFTTGQTHLATEQAGLAIRVEAEDQESLDQLKQVVWSHLVRFAFREPEREANWKAA